MELFKYSPSEDQTRRLNILIEILRIARKEKVRVIITGGYGLDALLGRLTRDHHDIDLFIDLRNKPIMDRILSKFNFKPTGKVVGESGKNEFASDDFGSDFTIEYGYIENGIKLIPEEKQSAFLPDEPIGSLNDIPVLTPTLYGFKEMIKLNNKLAAINNTPAYAHKAWMDEVVDLLEKRLS